MCHPVLAATLMVMGCSQGLLDDMRPGGVTYIREGTNSQQANADMYQCEQEIWGRGGRGSLFDGQAMYARSRLRRQIVAHGRK